MNGLFATFTSVTFVAVLPSGFVDDDATATTDSMKHSEGSAVTQKQILVGIVGADTKASWMKVSHLRATNGLSGLGQYIAASCERRLSSMKKGVFNTSDGVHAPHRNASAVSDPAFTPFVSASVDEIRYAQQLRDRLRERYPNRPSLPVSYWSVGAD
jgi:hypothetical protein